MEDSKLKLLSRKLHSSWHQEILPYTHHHATSVKKYLEYSYFIYSIERIKLKSNRIASRLLNKNLNKNLKFVKSHE